MSSGLAIILLSGGLDSATVLALARSHRQPCLTLTFDYGQRHRHELSAAAAIARALGSAEHRQIVLDPRAFAGSALTRPASTALPAPADGSTLAQVSARVGESPVPKHRSDIEIRDDIPATYVPARNLVFLSIAVATAESVGAREIHLGVNAVDYSGYPDCRPEFIDAMQRAARLGTKSGVQQADAIAIHTPLIAMTKAQIIRLGASLGVDLAMTHSCYDPSGTHQRPLACGACDACLLRRRGFEQAGIADPTAYASTAGAPP